MGSKPVGISGSRAATVLGLNEWQSELELWQRIMEEQYPGFNAEKGYTIPPDPDNASIRWGTAFEDAIVKLAEDKEGCEIFKREGLYYYHIGNPSYPNEACPDLISKVLPWGQYISCHIDGFYKNEFQKDIHGDYKTIHEGKTSSCYNWKDTYGEPGTDKVPAYIQCQVQHQLLCTGAEKCIVSVLVFPKRPDEWEDMGWNLKLKSRNWVYDKNGDKKEGYEEWWVCVNNTENIKTPAKYISPYFWADTLNWMGYFHQYPVQADEDLHKTMIGEYKKWWQKHIIEKQRPAPKTTDDIKRLFPEPVGTIVATEKIESLCSEYKQIGKEISKTGRLGKRREELKVTILDWMRQQDNALDDDSRDKTILRDRTGKKLVSWNGKAFR